MTWQTRSLWFSRTGLGLAVVGGLMFTAGAAAAEPTAADKTLARSLANQGYDALERKDFAGALDRFSRAEALVQVPTVTLGLARAYVGLGRLVEGHEAYRRILVLPPAPDAPPVIATAFSDARREAADLLPRLPGLVITVSGATSGGISLTVDGAPVATAVIGVRFPVDPGAHTVVASAPRTFPAKASVTVEEGKTESVVLELVVDPSARDEVPAPVAPPAWPPSRVAGVALLGVGALGVVVGAALTGAAYGKFSSLEQACPSRTGCDPSLAARADTYRALGTASIVSFAIGGAALATGALVFGLASKPKATTAALQLSPGFVSVGARFR